MQHQHSSWDNGWLNETFTELTDNGHLNGTLYPDDASDLDDLHLPDDLRGQSTVSFPQSVVTDGDNITEPPTPGYSFRPITPFPAKNSRQTPSTDSNYLSIDVLNVFNSQTFESYENLNWVSKLIDTQHNDNQPMPVESYDEYNFRNGPTSCSSVNHDVIEWSERGEKRKAVGPEEEELIEIFHGKKRRLSETIYTSLLEDTFDDLDENTINVCRGRSRNQSTLEVRLPHSSLPNSGHSETTGSTALHPQGTFPVDVNGNFLLTQLVSTSNNARPQSPLLPPVSSSCGTTAVNTHAPLFPLLATDDLPSLIELLTSYTQTSQTSSEAFRDWSTMSQNANSVSHMTYETSANERPHLCHQSPCGSYIRRSENDHTPKHINDPCLPLVSGSQIDFLPEEDDASIGFAGSVLSDSDNFCLPETIANGIKDFTKPLTATPGMDCRSLLQQLNNSGHHLQTAVASPGTSYHPQIYVPSPVTSHLPQISVPSPGTSHRPQTSVPSPGTSCHPQISVPSPVTSRFPQTSIPSPGPSYHPQTSVSTPRPSCHSKNSVAAQGLPQHHNISGVNISKPNLAVEDDSPMMVQLPLDNMDPHLAETYQNACQRNSPEELTKYILRTKILLKKNESGKKDDESQPEPQVKYEMTPEELEKSQKRKELNRLAAAKHRISKKQQREKFEQEINDLLNKNQEFKNEIRLKEEAKEKLILDLLEAGVSEETIQLALERLF